MKTFCTAGAVFGACTAVRWYLDRTSRRDVLRCKGHLRITDCRNDGAAFGLPLPEKAVEPLAAVTLGSVWALRRHSPWGAGLLLGGGICNLWERRRYGAVCDYVQFPKAPGPWNRYVFNLADFAILAGAAALAVGGQRKERKRLWKN